MIYYIYIYILIYTYIYIYCMNEFPPHDKSMAKFTLAPNFPTSRSKMCINFAVESCCGCVSLHDRYSFMPIFKQRYVKKLACMHIYVNLYIYIHTYIFICTCIHVYVCIYTHIYIYTHSLSHTRTPYIHIHTHTHTHTHTHLKATQINNMCRCSCAHT